MRCTSFYECSDVPTCKVGHCGAWEKFYPEDLQTNCLRLESTLELLLRMELPGRPKNRGHSVLRLVTLEILIRSASDLAQFKVISFLTLNRNLFESSLENKVAPSSE